MESLDSIIHNVENYLVTCVIYLIESLSICIADIWPCAFLSLEYDNVFERNAHCESFSAHFLDHIISAYATTGWQKERKREKPRCHTCCTRVRERHVPLGATSRLRLMFQRCQVKRRSCSLYHSDLDGINSRDTIIRSRSHHNLKSV